MTLRARWVTLRARWVTLRARWVTFEQGHDGGADDERWVRGRWVPHANAFVVTYGASTPLSLQLNSDFSKVSTGSSAPRNPHHTRSKMGSWSVCGVDVATHSRPVGS